jgi:hypothetical protein
MAEQTFRSPGFFEREIDLSQRESEIVGVPAGVVGTAEMGPAFVPVTVGSFADFEKKFGTLDPKKFGPYAVREFFKYKTALTYVRVLGAGSNETSTDIANTRSAGIVKNAGFKIIGSNPGPTIPSAQGRFQGCVQFIAAEHWVSSSQEGIGYPIFSDNDSFPKVSGQRVERARLIRGMLFTATGSRFEILCMQSASYGITAAKQTDTATVNTSGEFKLVLSSAAGTSFANDDGWPGIRIYTASLNPVADTYIGKLLNTDPERFGQEQHLLYADFPVEDEIASVSYGTNAPTVALLSGSTSTSLDSGVSGLSFINGFGRFDTRYASPKTTSFISQPYGDTEFDLFYVESISDGSVANEKFKVSISNVRKSSDPKNPYGTFTLEVRDFDDTDTAKKTLESYPLCTLNPLDDDYLAKKVGDFKAFYNFDAELDDERKVLVSGKYPNKSSRVRVIMSVGLESGEVPKDALPFGFRGFGCLKTNDTLTNNQTTSIRGGIGSSISNRTTFWSGSLDHTDANQSQSKLVSRLSGSILPPVPFRFKVTRGAVDSSSPAYIGAPGDDERVDTRFYWGSKFDRLPRTGSLSNSIFDSNVSSEINNIFRSYSKLLGIEKLDNLVTGSGADAFNNNKFTLARVALSNEIRSVSGTPSLPATANSDITGSAKEHILETAYIRNGRVDASNYTVSDNLRGINRITFASLASLTSSVYFNRFTDYAKFTNFMHGGFDGLNILNAEMARMSDRASSSDTGGYAAGGTLDLGLSSDNTYGAGKTNTIVASYRVGARILTDPMASRVNILMIPGIRDSALTDYVQSRLSNYSKAFYVMDLPGYDADQTRLFDDSDTAANVQKTAEQLEGRALDSNYSATYFPDVTIEDPINNMPVVVPASVAVMGALAYNDNVAYPWFAPAGFNRAALDFVSNVGVRLNQSDRDTLYDAKINPIATFPGAGFVIFGQKTLQLSKSALDRVNVRRMLLEVKRLIVDVANKIVFEQNTPETRARFVAQATPLLATIQGQQGIDQFKVVMDASNNSQEDIENNILNGKIVLVPTRAVEFIAIDFIITNAGVSFD